MYDREERKNILNNLKRAESQRSLKVLRELY